MGRGRPMQHGRQDKRIEAIVRTALCVQRWSIPRDVAEDCLQEARLCVWRARKRLQQLSDPGRTAYADACIRHAVRRVLERERLHQVNTLSLDSGEGETVAPAEDRAAPEPVAPLPAFADPRWLDQVEPPELGEMLSRLGTRDRMILHLYYAFDMTDREVAGELAVPVTTVEQRRHRLLRKIRRGVTLGREPAAAEKVVPRRCQLSGGRGA